MSGAVGVIIFILGLLVSIGLHEIGHMYPAKKFGVRVSEYMIGFGPTLWSRVKGETEYGLKAIPLGGYVRIIGMFGPKKETADGQSEAKSAEPDATELNTAELKSAELSQDDTQEPQPSQGLFKSLITGARTASLAEILPGEENRAFYLLSAPKKFVVMFGGPFMNLLLACIMLTTALVWVGSPTATTLVNRVVQCLSTPANPDGLLSNDGTCGEGDFSPAHKAGLKSGDKLLEIGGRQVSSWDELGELLRGNENKFVTVTYQRSTNQVMSKRVKIATREVAVYDANGNSTGKTEQVGYLGVTPKILMQGESISTMPSYLWSELGTTFSAILSFPRAMLGMGQVLMSSEPRPEEGPVSVVGISQISSDIASGENATFRDKLGSFLMLFGSLNMFLFAFNLVPILPLDGGHLAGALYEGARRRLAKLRGQPDPGPVDTARMMPLAYVMGLLLIGLAILSILTDLIKPISF